MFRTILFFIYFWLFLILSLFIYGFYKLLGFILPKANNKILLVLVQWWARNILRIGGIKLNLSGSENIPKNSRVCFVSNHQSNYDIGILISAIPMIIGFIAKVELKKYLPLRVWMEEINCLFINRKKPKLSIKNVEERIQAIKEGKTLLIFPEGTRSKGYNMQSFKTGSLRLLVENNIEIVPITIKNSFLRYEKEKRIKPGKIDIIIHPSINPLEYDNKDLVLYKICETIKSGLPDF